MARDARDGSKAKIRAGCKGGLSPESLQIARDPPPYPRYGPFVKVFRPKLADALASARRGVSPPTTEKQRAERHKSKEGVWFSKVLVRLMISLIQ